MIGEEHIYLVVFHWGNRKFNVVAGGYGEAVDTAFGELPKDTRMEELHRAGVEVTRLEGPVVYPNKKYTL